MSSICVMAHDPQLLKSLDQLFSRAGFSVSSFTKPGSLLGALHEDAPQCVVAEYLSPSKATIQLVEQILDTLPKLPIILIGAGDDVSTAVQAIHAGAYDFVQKPIVDRLLIESVQTAILR